MKVAMISYNAFVDGERNGWKNHGANSVLLLQNADGSKWGMTQFGKTHEQWSGEAKAIVDPLWGQLQSELPTIDKVIFYVGSYGAERVIELAAKYGLTPDRAVFVLCNCNMAKKTGMIYQFGFFSSKVVNCECGGHGTMRRLYEDALVTGSLPSQRSAT